jgi:hypothetical protein
MVSPLGGPQGTHGLRALIMLDWFMCCSKCGVVDVLQGRLAEQHSATQNGHMIHSSQDCLGHTALPRTAALACAC